MSDVFPNRQARRESMNTFLLVLLVVWAVVDRL